MRMVLSRSLKHFCSLLNQCLEPCFLLIGDKGGVTSRVTPPSVCVIESCYLL